MHIRRQIRAAVAALLTEAGAESDPAPWEDRVYQGKRWRWQIEELPGAAIYTDAETLSIETFDRLQRRSIVLVVDLCARPPEGAGALSDEALEDLLDEMGARLEQTIGRDNRLGGIAFDLQLSSVQTVASMEGEVLVATRRHQFTCTTMRAEGDPDAVTEE